VAITDRADGMTAIACMQAVAHSFQKDDTLSSPMLGLAAATPPNEKALASTAAPSAVTRRVDPMRAAMNMATGVPAPRAPLAVVMSVHFGRPRQLFLTPSRVHVPKTAVTEWLSELRGARDDAFRSCRPRTDSLQALQLFGSHS
jgi:hypothetical protein